MPGLAQHRPAVDGRQVGVEPEAVDPAATCAVVVRLGEEVQSALAPEAEGVGQEGVGRARVQPADMGSGQRLLVAAGVDADLRQSDAPDVLGHDHGLAGSLALGNAAIARRTLLGGLATLAAAPAFAAARAAPPVGFVALGDWGRRGDIVQRGVAQGMALAAHEIESRFVIAAGDNFYPGGVASVTDPHWKQSFEDVYTDAALRTPWYPALGNHDYRGVPQAQVAYTGHSRRWRMPGRYYRVPGAAVGAPQLDLFVIDTTPMVDDVNLGERVQQLCRGHWWEEQPDPQLAWLRTALARSRAPWKIVVGHHPIYSGSHGDSPVLIARVAPLLEAFGVQAYVNGHDHDLAAHPAQAGRLRLHRRRSGGRAGPADPRDTLLSRQPRLRQLSPGGRFDATGIP